MPDTLYLRQKSKISNEKDLLKSEAKHCPQNQYAKKIKDYKVYKVLFPRSWQLAQLPLRTKYHLPTHKVKKAPILKLITSNKGNQSRRIIS